jgi:hypothetical protein
VRHQAVCIMSGNRRHKTAKPVRAAPRPNIADACAKACARREMLSSDLAAARRTRAPRKGCFRCHAPRRPGRRQAFAPRAGGRNRSTYSACLHESQAMAIPVPPSSSCTATRSCTTTCPRWMMTTSRRGKPTVHKAFDEATAILAGDALQTLAFDVLTREATHSDPAVRAALVQLSCQRPAASAAWPAARCSTWKPKDGSPPVKAPRCAFELGDVEAPAAHEDRRPACRLLPKPARFSEERLDDVEQSVRSMRYGARDRLCLPARGRSSSMSKATPPRSARRSARTPQRTRAHFVSMQSAFRLARSESSTHSSDEAKCSHFGSIRQRAPNG